MLSVTSADSQHRYPFQWWNIPDSISEKLDSVYGEPDSGAGRNVRKLGVYDDFEFQNGVYSYRVVLVLIYRLIFSILF